MGTGWVRFKSGLQICYGGVKNDNNIATGQARFSYPVAFSADPIIVATPAINGGIYFVSASNDGTSSWILTSVLAYDGIRKTADAIIVNYVAIGKWK